LYGKIDVKIKGITPLLMNRLTLESLKPSVPKIDQKVDPVVEAANSAYMADIDGKKQLYIPAEAIYGCIITVSGAYRARRVSLRSILAGSIRVEPEKIPLGKDVYELDIRPVKIKRFRIPRARAKVWPWEAKFNIVYYKASISDAILETLKTILEDGGRRVGILDFRPEHRGWFGTFEVEEFNIVESA
jgi:hypothetical protein